MGPHGFVVQCVLLVWAAGSGFCEGNVTLTTTTTPPFTAPPADSMSRLMPTTPSLELSANDTKDPSASNIDIVTTPDTGALGTFSKYAEPSDSFSPSPFLGVISEAHINNYPQGVAIGEVFPEKVDDRHLGGHKYLYSIAGQRAPHTGHSYLDQVTRQRPSSPTPTDSVDGYQAVLGQPEKIAFFSTPETLRPTVETGYPSFTYSPSKEHSLTSSTKSLSYPIFEIPERFKEFNTNAITDYKPPPIVQFPGLGKPIREDILGERPLRHEDHPDGFPNEGGPEGYGPPALPHPPNFGSPPPFGSPPAFINKSPGLYKRGKWNGVFKVLASLIPLGLLVAAFSPNLLVVNATEDPAAPLVELPSAQAQLNSQRPSAALSSQSSPEWTKIPTWSPTSTAKTAYRSLEGPPEIPAGFLMTQCQKKKVCEALAGVDDSYRSFIDSLVIRVGGSMKEAAELGAANKCEDIPCGQ